MNDEIFIHVTEPQLPVLAYFDSTTDQFYLFCSLYRKLCFSSWHCGAFFCINSATHWTVHQSSQEHTRNHCVANMLGMRLNLPKEYSKSHEKTEESKKSTIPT